MTTTDGEGLLDRVSAWLAPHLALPSEHCLPVLTLWAAHTHAADAFYVTPRLVLSSAEPGSGKTRVLELLALICHQPELILSPTTAAIFRMLGDGPMSLLFDEIDAVFNPKAGANNEDLRALLNAGYKRGATIPRCVGDAAKMAVQRYRVYAPVALAGLAGHLPATILTRAVVIHMRKRPQGTKVRSFRERDAETEASPLAAELGEWTSANLHVLANARPEMPEGVDDRPAEVWEALLAIADEAGGHWPATARAACEHFVLRQTGEPGSFGTRLLADLRHIFGGETRMSTSDIITALTNMPEGPWADLGGKPLDAAKLAKLLRPYEVLPVPFKHGGLGLRGYTTYPTDSRDQNNAGLQDAWSRYLPPQAGNATPEEKRDTTTESGAVPCRQCGQQLMLITPGRDLCTGCEISNRQTRTGGTP